MSLVLPAARKVDDRQAREDAVRVVVDQSDLQTGATISIVTTVAIDHCIPMFHSHCSHSAVIPTSVI